MSRELSGKAISDRHVCVVVPTVATNERASHLLRAVDSICSQSDVDAIAVVVANGSNCDENLLRQIGSISGVRLIRQPRGSLSGALATGRDAVDTTYFAELDDDDYLLPNTLCRRVETLRANPDVDALICNGIVRDGTREWLSIDDIPGAQHDSLSALLRMNWMLPGCGLFRTESVTADYFAKMPTYLEWTGLALQLATRHKLLFAAEPDFVHVEDHPFSIDRSVACVIGRARAVEQLLLLELPPKVREQLEGRLSSAHHSASNVHLNHNELAAAWRAHLRSLQGRRGLRYLSYTRHLIGALIKTPRSTAPTLPANKLEHIDDITH